MARCIRLQRWFSCSSFPLVGDLPSKAKEHLLSLRFTFGVTSPVGDLLDKTDECFLPRFLFGVFHLLDWLHTTVYESSLPGVFFDVFLHLVRLPTMAGEL